jgi:predicted permease
MSILGNWGRRVWYLLNRRRFERDLEREMASHRAQLEEPHRFGSTLRLREQSADAWGWTWIDDLARDVTYGARQLRRAPGFAAVSILTLAVGIGANTAIFSVLNGELFGVPPVRDPGSLRTLESNRGTARVTYEEFLPLTRAQSIEAAACTTGATPSRIGIDEQRASALVQRVTGDYYRMLGVSMALGRPLTVADDRPDAVPVAVISDGAWRRLFASDPDVVGRQLTIGNVPFTVVGVTPRGFYATPRWRRVEITTSMQAPMTLDVPSGDPRKNDDTACQVLVRVRPEVSDKQTDAEAALLLERGAAARPAAGRSLPGRFTARLRPFGRGIDELDPRDLSREAPTLAAASFLFTAMLLIPCANIAGVMLARAVTRRREIASRLALGASRHRIVRQLLTEGLLLSTIAGLIGVALCQAVWVVMRDQFANGNGPAVVFDARVLAWSAGLCLAATIAFALAPALRATRFEISSTMRDGGTGGVASSRFSAGRMLTALQVVVASVLLIGAAVQARTMLVSMAPLAVEPERVTVIDTGAGTSGSAERYVRDALARLENVAGVARASAMIPTPQNVELCPRDPGSGESVSVTDVAPGFFATTRIPMRRGRDFRWNDEDVVVVNEALARRLSGGSDPIGRTLRMWECGERLTVVGVVADSRNAVSPGSGMMPTLYRPLFSDALETMDSVRFLVRAGGAPVSAAGLVARLKEADAAVPIDKVQTQADLLAGYMRAQRVVSALLAAVGLLAVFQAAFGIYGVLAHFVNRRTAEIGVRMVLGATSNDVLRLVVRQSLMPVVVGLIIVIGLAPLAIVILERGQFTTPLAARDQVLVLLPVLALLMAAFAAACAPAIRATRITPSIAVRAE